MKKLISIIVSVFFLLSTSNSQNLPLKISTDPHLKLTQGIVPLYAGKTPIRYPEQFIKTITRKENPSDIQKYFDDLNRITAGAGGGFLTDVIWGEYYFNNSWYNMFWSQYSWLQTFDSWVLSSYISRMWDQNVNDYVDDYRSEYSYNDQWQMTGYNSYTWDGTDWSLTSAGYYYYDEFENMNMYIYESYWSGIFSSYKTEYVYDEYGELIAEITYNWNSQTSSWEEAWRYDYYWGSDIFGDWEKDVFSTWNGSEWVEQSMWTGYYTPFGLFDYVTYYDNPDGAFVNSKSHYSDKIATNWVEESKVDYDYDGNERKVQELNQSWNGSDWDNTDKTEYSYYMDTDDFLERNTYLWYEQNWENQQSYYWEYDQNGYNTLYRGGQWDSGNYEDQWHNIYTNDENGRVITDLYEEVNNLTSNWEPVWRDHYSYIEISDVNNNLSDIPKDYSLLQNYPNPFNPTTTIKFSIPSVGDAKFASTTTKLVVYDILGREVATLVNQKLQPGNHEVHFDASDLSSGIYFYRIDVSNKYQSVKKMMLIK